jgi:hypothetical protein
MYYKKTYDRLNELRGNALFAPFFISPIEVNDKKYKSLDQIIPILDSTVKNNLMNCTYFCIIHGDMCFANILIDEKFNFIKLIDPRGQFGSFDIYGDQRYELAKLFHSVDGEYDYIIKDMFTLEKHNNHISYVIDSTKGSLLYSLMKECFSDLINGNLKEIEIIESLLFLSMIPLHSENQNHQLAMLATGLQILDRWVNIEENN